MSVKAQETLKDLNMGAIFTGRISQIHADNMKIYPFVFFDNVLEANISYDVLADQSVPGAKSTISYEILFAENKIPENLNEGLKHLQKALSVLFMRNIVTIIRDTNGQQLGIAAGDSHVQ